jgi:hypothetical protein
MTLTKEQKREVARRIENWARWYFGRKNVNVARPHLSPFPAYNLVNAFSPRDPDELKYIPVLSGEAEDTDRIMRGMYPELVKALIVYYLSRGTPKSKARRCKCKTVRTYERRVERAGTVFLRFCYPRQRQEFTMEIDILT